MALIKWNNSLSVGIESIDQQHQQLFGFINDIHDAMSAGKGNDAVASIAGQLLQYTKEHFKFEEQMLKQMNYPKLNDHHKVHGYLTDQVTQIYNRLNSGEKLNPIQLSNFLKDWLKNHILKIDMHYAKHNNSVSV